MSDRLTESGGRRVRGPTLKGNEGITGCWLLRRGWLPLVWRVGLPIAGYIHHGRGRERNPPLVTKGAQPAHKEWQLCAVRGCRVERVALIFGFAVAGRRHQRDVPLGSARFGSFPRKESLTNLGTFGEANW
jgi:hypothetical protein